LGVSVVPSIWNVREQRSITEPPWLSDHPTPATPLAWLPPRLEYRSATCGAIPARPSGTSIGSVYS
jgi:hypothetical protein